MVRGNHYSMDNFWIRLSAWTLAFSFVFGMVFGLFFIASVPFWLLWNWLIPSIFGLPSITLLQAFGLWLFLVLIRSTKFNYSKTFNNTQEVLNQEDLEWDNFVYLRKSLRGKHLELWQHISGCRQWFKVQRDTATHEIFKTLKANEDI